MVDLFIAYGSNSRKAISYIEDGFANLGPDETPFNYCVEAHKGDRDRHHLCTNDQEKSHVIDLNSGN